ncbi:hypothetical protein SSX86_032714, partial [Deinandra increscens subsp. villosa]
MALLFRDISHWDIILVRKVCHIHQLSNHSYSGDLGEPFFVTDFIVFLCFISDSAVKSGGIQVDGKAVPISYRVQFSDKISHFVHRFGPAGNPRGAEIASNHHDHSAGADDPYVCDWKTEVGWSLCNLKLYGFGKLLQ